ncbi:hypothetical protein DMUE_3310 [Dictyocoela muelleri]|nr:hypothetical protein DMUE_3310 [Dictyocoela muelleri]
MYFLKKTASLSALSKILTKHTKYITITPTKLVATSSLHTGIKIHVLCAPITNTKFTIKTSEFQDLEGSFAIKQNFLIYKKTISAGSDYFIERRIPILNEILPDNVDTPILKLKLNKDASSLFKGIIVKFNDKIIVDNTVFIDYKDMILNDNSTFTQNTNTDGLININDYENTIFSSYKNYCNFYFKNNNLFPPFKLKGKDLSFLDDFDEMILCIFKDYCVFYSFHDEYTVGIRVCHMI